MPYFRSDQAIINVEVSGIPIDKESWDMMEGGDPVAEETAVYPGGMAPQKALGGLPKWSTLTVERAWSDTLAAQFKTLQNASGVASAVVSYHVLNAQKVPTGAVFTYTGVLTSAVRPAYKASESVVAYLRLTFGIDGAVT